MIAIRHTTTFECEGEVLVGVMTRPAQPLSRGIVIVVGGPQYRVGSHRHFVLLADRLAEAGHAVLRFDCRGMGDSTGQFRGFENIENDVRAAIDALFGAVPTVRDVVLWGLCDGATAALLYAPDDARVTGVALLNPWVRSSETEAKARLRHYYLKRAGSMEAWRGLLRRGSHVAAAMRSVVDNVRSAMACTEAASGQSAEPTSASAKPLRERMADALMRFPGEVLIILSGQDLTAREFADVTRASRRWRQLFAAPRITRHDLPAATHTFSRREWRDQVAIWTEAWVAAQ